MNEQQKLSKMIQWHIQKMRVEHAVLMRYAKKEFLLILALFGIWIVFEIIIWNLLK